MEAIPAVEDNSVNDVVVPKQETRKAGEHSQAEDTSVGVVLPQQESDPVKEECPQEATGVFRFRCEHCIPLCVCEECSIGVSTEDLRRNRKEHNEHFDARLAARKERVKALNAEMNAALQKQQGRKKRKGRRGRDQIAAAAAAQVVSEPVPEAPLGTRKVRFNLDNVPQLVKEQGFY